MVTYVEVFVVLMLCFATAGTKAQYDDVRCKCICPNDRKSNKTKNVWTATVEPFECTCAHVVKKEDKFCLRCQCSYEARNTTLIKVVIILILVMLGVLMVYMAFLFLDYKRRPVEFSITADEVRYEQIPPPLPSQRRPRGLSFKSFDQNLSKWKRTVAEQRRNIYDTHTMLS